MDRIWIQTMRIELPVEHGKLSTLHAAIFGGWLAQWLIYVLPFNKDKTRQVWDLGNGAREIDSFTKKRMKEVPMYNLQQRNNCSSPNNSFSLDGRITDTYTSFKFKEAQIRSCQNLTLTYICQIQTSRWFKVVVEDAKNLTLRPGIMGRWVGTEAALGD